MLKVWDLPDSLLWHCNFLVAHAQVIDVFPVLFKYKPIDSVVISEVNVLEYLP